jgi:amidohydrolase
MAPTESSFTEAERAELIRLRRDLHQHPELGLAEHRTAGVVAEHLRGLGLTPTTGLAETGVTALLGDAGSRTLLLRADMDALPVTEIAERPYRSQNEGVMHACGHDGHTATLLTACSALAREAESWRGQGRVKAVFQPAEEGMDGARRMIAAGVLEDPKPDAALALHYWSQLATGKVAVQAGPVMAATDEFHVVVKGKGGHAAMPHQAVDPLVAAAQVVTALQTLVTRRSDPMAALVLTVGEFHAGTAFNVIPGEARLSGTARCFDRNIWEALPEQMEEILAATCRAHGCEVELDYRRITTPVTNDAAMAALVRTEAVALLGEENVVELRMLGGEDICYFLEAVPGCFFFVGSGSEAKGTTAPHHHPAFDLDEDALAIGAELLLRSARRYLRGR